MAHKRARPNTAAIYCRLSRRPDDGKVMTVAEQERLLEAEAERRHLTVVGSYADNGIGAYKRAHRPGFAELLAALDGGGVGHVLVVALDRASRRVGDVAMLRDALDDAGALLVADGREYDPSDDALSIYLTGIVSEQESRDKSRRVLAAKEQALALGLYNGGRRPFGFTKPPGAGRGYWIQEADEAAAIHAGAKLILDGASLIEVAQEWTAQGLATPGSSSPWTAAKVRRTLLSPIVAGLRTHDGEVTGTLMRPDGTPWPAILTPEKRDELGRVLRGRYGNKPKRWHSARPALLSGLIVCGQCGHNLTPRRYGDRRPTMYSCNADGGERCGTIGVTAHHVDAIVTEAVCHRLDSAELRRALAKPKRAPRKGDDPSVLQADLDALADAAGRGELPVREYLRAWGPLEERLQRALADLETDDDRAVLVPIVTSADPVAAWEGLDDDLDRRRSVLAAMISTVTVAPSDGIRGTFRPERINVEWRA